MSEFKSPLQHADPLADARAWLAHMEQKLVSLAARPAPDKENGPADVEAKVVEVETLP